MTDTPDKEWIERAADWLDQNDGITAVDAHTRVLCDAQRRSLARELQSSFDQGVEREMERSAELRRFVKALYIGDPDALSNPRLNAGVALGVLTAPERQS